jgi:hypothetical protein|tara:strand:+ start:224 stop:787 length:564 start_codon:yes stop_codon:yes gene_type:complete
MQIRKREELTSLLNKLNLSGQGVEVGVQEGIFSEILLKDSTLNRLYSIDSWRSFEKEEYYDKANVYDFLHYQNYLKTRFRLMKFKNRSICLRMLSEDATQLFEDNELDFIYLDANHSYNAIKKDIQLWWPKIKKGGVLAGHDYLDGTLWCGEFGVKSAVDEFVRNKELRLYVTTDEDQFKTWYFLKE